MANIIGTGYDNPGKSVFREFTVDGQTVHAPMVSLPPSDPVVANPPTRTATRKRINISTSGANTIVAAPAAGNRICYEFLKIQNNSTASITALIKFGADDTDYDTVIMTAKGDGFIDDARHGFVPLPAATALIIDLDGANAVVGQLRYWVEAV